MRAARALASVVVLSSTLWAPGGAARPRPPAPVVDPAGLVELARLGGEAASIRLDLRYATADNFTHRTVYPQARCLLRREVAVRLMAVEARLRARGLHLKLYDCYRPLSVQRLFFQLVPDERYVADPKKGSRHNRGAAVDLTLVDEAGRELPMGTGFDDFSARAHRDATGLPEEVVRNRALLDEVMGAAGFTGMPTEWWHYDGPGWERYPLLDVPMQAVR